MPPLPSPPDSAKPVENPSAAHASDLTDPASALPADSPAPPEAPPAASSNPPAMPHSSSATASAPVTNAPVVSAPPSNASVAGAPVGSATVASAPAAGAAVAEQYRALLEKACAKFARLRELPLYGRQRWEARFHKAFSVYSRLWRFQQEHRARLVDHGLKRWEIGEIASRIGQLYYNYYLRTGDASYLLEAFIFYDAIHRREYFREAARGDAAVAHKQLRWLARFTVVCVLLGRREMLRQLLWQLRLLVDDYARAFQAADAAEWKGVVHEAVRFLRADWPSDCPRPLRYSVLLDPPPGALPPVATLMAPGAPRALALQEVVITSFYPLEVKLSELTLDAFRVLQAVEWLPSGFFVKTAQGGGRGRGAAPGGGAEENVVDPSLPPNPHKYVLHRPTVPHLLMVLATAVDELPPDAALLLYLSATATLAAPPAAAAPLPAPSASTPDPSAASPAAPAVASSSSSVSREEGGLASGPSGDAAASAAAEAGARPGESKQCSSSAADAGGGGSAEGQGTEGQTGSRARGDGGEGDGGRGGDGVWLRMGVGPEEAHMCYLRASDILPFTRRPLVLIVDSDNSMAFEWVHGRERGQPCAMLLSPRLQPDISSAPRPSRSQPSTTATATATAEMASSASAQPASAAAAADMGAEAPSAHPTAGPSSPSSALSAAPAAPAAAPPASSTSSSPLSLATATHLAGGNLFTLFLTAPLQAFCRLTAVHLPDVPKERYMAWERHLAMLLSQWGSSLAACPTLPLAWARLLLDPFLRLFLLRFVFARAVLALHVSYAARPAFHPHCCPPLPATMLPSHPAIHSAVRHLAQQCGVAAQFPPPSSSPCPPQVTEKRGDGEVVVGGSAVGAGAAGAASGEEGGAEGRGESGEGMERGGSRDAESGSSAITGAGTSSGSGVDTGSEGGSEGGRTVSVEERRRQFAAGRIGGVPVLGGMGFDSFRQDTVVGGAGAVQGGGDAEAAWEQPAVGDEG
ncbi:hypothetical protein CLOM_g6264 [Closterium sp. NIES-68]|nr:hypothetical protein CLOM_g6264 [Closterium sp. NIES-68]